MRSEKHAGMLMLLSVGAVLAGCTSTSGPTYSAYSVTLPNAEKAYQVECLGLFEDAKTCYSKAREICSQQPIREVQSVASLAAQSSGQRDVHMLTFQCGTTPTPQPAPVVQPPAAPMPQRMTLGGDANFDFDKATLTQDAHGRLDRLLGQARDMTFGTVTVNGFTDSIGSDAYNVALSQRRAEAVAQYLQTNGLRARNVVARGYGKGGPVASNSTDSGRAANRRVEIELNQDR